MGVTPPVCSDACLRRLCVSTYWTGAGPRPGPQRTCTLYIEFADAIHARGKVVCAVCAGSYVKETNSPSSNALASWRSAVSKPSVNQP